MNLFKKPLKYLKEWVFGDAISLIKYSVKYWKPVVFIIAGIYTGYQYIEIRHYKLVAETALSRAIQAETTLSTVIKSQEWTEEVISKLETKKEQTHADQTKTKTSVSTDVPVVSDADAKLLRDYSKTINSRYASDSK